MTLLSTHGTLGVTLNELIISNVSSWFRMLMRYRGEPEIKTANTMWSPAPRPRGQNTCDTAA